MPVSPSDVATLRAFNRFHTELVGALGRRILDSPHSLTESRLLFEIAHANPSTAADLARIFDSIRLISAAPCASSPTPN